MSGVVCSAGDEIIIGICQKKLGFRSVRLFHSYRTKYNGLAASFFLSSREILLSEPTLLNSTFALIEFDLDGFSF